MKVQDLVTLVPWTIVAQLCNLFIQLLLIKRFLFKPISEILEKRRQKADEQIREAEEAKAQAQAMKESYEKDMAEARQKAGEILATAQKNAADQSERMLQEAAGEAAAIRARAQSEVAQERRKAVNEAKNEIGGIAMEIAGKVIEREISEEDHRKLIEEFIENVGEAS